MEEANVSGAAKSISGIDKKHLNWIALIALVSSAGQHAQAIEAIVARRKVFGGWGLISASSSAMRASDSS
jgi:hypothetical protein